MATQQDSKAPEQQLDGGLLSSRTGRKFGDLLAQLYAGPSTIGDRTETHAEEDSMAAAVAVRLIITSMSGSSGATMLGCMNPKPEGPMRKLSLPVVAPCLHCTTYF